MRIEIKLLTQFKEYLPDPGLAGNTRSITINGSGKIVDVFKELGIPLNVPKVIMLNDRHATIEDPLKEGDRVTVFPPVGGGMFGSTTEPPKSAGSGGRFFCPSYHIKSSGGMLPRAGKANRSVEACGKMNWL